MNEAYTKLMLQQHTSPEADAAFFEKLESTGTTKHHRPAWKAAIAAACILLLIPVTVFALDNIFSVAKVTEYECPTFNNKPGIGLDIHYENLEYHQIEDFSNHLQSLEESELVFHDTWADAEAYLGINLLDNSFFTSEDTRQIGHYKVSQNEPWKHCTGNYRAVDGQLTTAIIKAAYRCRYTEFVIEATATAEHPSVSYTDSQKGPHDSTLLYSKWNNPKIRTEQYMTSAGIPVLIITVTSQKWSGMVDCNAFFAVDNISYKMEICNYRISPSDLEVYSSPEDKVIAFTKEVLEGFTVE